MLLGASHPVHVVLRYHYIVQHLRSAADLPRVAHELGLAANTSFTQLPVTLPAAAAVLRRAAPADALSPGSRVAELTKRSSARRKSDIGVGLARRASTSSGVASSSRSSGDHAAARVLASFGSLQRAVHRSRERAVQLTLQRDDLRRRLRDASVRLAGTQRLLDHSRQALADEARAGAEVSEYGGALVRQSPGSSLCGPTARGLIVAIAVALLALFLSSVVLRTPDDDWVERRT